MSEVVDVLNRLEAMCRENGIDSEQIEISSTSLDVCMRLQAAVVRSVDRGLLVAGTRLADHEGCVVNGIRIGVLRTA